MNDFYQALEPKSGKCTAADIERRIRENLEWAEVVEEASPPMSRGALYWLVLIVLLDLGVISLLIQWIYK